MPLQGAVRPVEPSYSRTALQTLAIADAAKYGLSGKQTVQMLDTITCESQWDVTVVSLTKDYGIAQWNIASHSMTIEQAFDPTYALDKMAQAFSQGHQSWWVCYERLFS